MAGIPLIAAGMAKQITIVQYEFRTSTLRHSSCSAITLRHAKIKHRLSYRERVRIEKYDPCKNSTLGQISPGGSYFQFLLGNCKISKSYLVIDYYLAVSCSKSNHSPMLSFLIS